MINRRTCIISAAIGVTWPALSFGQQRTLVISGSGGAVAEVNNTIYYQPFTAATGIRIEHVGTEQQRMAQLEAMVRVGRTTWDVMEISASNYPIGAKKGLFEVLDYSKIDPKNVLPAVAKLPYGVATAAYSVVLVVRRDKLPAGKSITSWADFWDVKTFPGPRALSATPQDNLEFALLADGVAVKDVYKVLATKEGEDRAFRKLDQIKRHVTKWWKSGSEAVQLVNDGEVFFGTMYNGRVEKLKTSGIPVEIVWNGGGLHMAYIGIPKGARNVVDAYEFIKVRSTDAPKMRTYIVQMPYPGFAPALYDGMKEDIVRTFPTYPSNLNVQFGADEMFWADNINRIQERWNEWLLK